MRIATDYSGGLGFVVIREIPVNLWLNVLIRGPLGRCASVVKALPCVIIRSFRGG